MAWSCRVIEFLGTCRFIGFIGFRILSFCLIVGFGFVGLEWFGVADAQCKRTVQMHCANALCKRTVQTYCTNALCKCTVQMHCTNALYKFTVQTYCANVLCKCTVQTYCANTLYKRTVQALCKHSAVSTVHTNAPPRHVNYAGVCKPA